MGRLALLALAACCSAAAPAAAAEEVDLALILAVDISTSMDAGEQQLQRDGYVAAFRHADVLAAIASGAHGRIVVSYVEWAGRDIHSTIVPWTVIGDPAGAEAFASALAAAPLRQAAGTSISSALLYAGSQFKARDYPAARHAVDISGDGPNNGGQPVDLMRDWLVRRGVTINGLPIMLRPEPDLEAGTLDEYFEECVIGGPGAFMIPVTDADNFATAIRSKLVLEIAGLSPPPRPLPIALAGTPWIDCAVAEKER
jgi:hypothetical protein